MARGILNCPRILNATSPPCILVEPVANETRFRINRSLFLERIMAQLNSKTDNKVVFLDREHMNQLLQERNLAQSGQVTSSGNPYVQEFKGADFLLTGKLQGLSSVTSAGQSDYVFYTFILIDTRTTERVWQDAAEIRKEAQEDAVYR